MTEQKGPNYRFRRVIDPAQTFYHLRRIWYIYGVYPQRYWRRIAWVVLVISLGFLLFYLPLLLPENQFLHIPAKSYVHQQDTASVGLVYFEAQLPRYVAPSREIQFELFLEQLEPPLDGEEITFELGNPPDGLNKIATERQRVLLQKGLEDRWQSRSTITYTLPANLYEKDLVLTIRAQNEPPQEYTISLSPDPIPIVRWPSYIFQIIAFFTAFGVLSLTDIVPRLKSIFNKNQT